MIKYNDIIKHFNKEEWDFSYIKYNEIWEILNQPTKMGFSIENILFRKNPLPREQSILLVCVKKTKDFDYTFFSPFIYECKKYFPDLNIKEFQCNYKYAAVRAGLGQYTKNSLFYHSHFNFDTHIGVFLIEEDIVELPERKSANFNLLSMCNNCNDCIKACPVNAIHYENNKTWINTYDCDNFCSFGNSSKIPSLKWNWFTLDEDLNSIFTNFEDIYNVQNYYDLSQKSNKLNSRMIKINNKNHTVVFPICRECTSQQKCTKYNGNYPYKWNDIIIK